MAKNLRSRSRFQHSQLDHDWHRNYMELGILLCNRLPMWTGLEPQLGTYRDIFDTMLQHSGHAKRIHCD